MKKPILLNVVVNSRTLAIPGDCMDETYTYTCPCGKGRILEKHKDRPYGHSHLVTIECEDCKKKYYPTGENNMREWHLLPIPPKPKGPPTEEELEAQRREQEKIARRTGVVLDIPNSEEELSSDIPDPD